jgi:hypothetical protein
LGVVPVLAIEELVGEPVARPSIWTFSAALFDSFPGTLISMPDRPLVV